MRLLTRARALTQGYWFAPGLLDPAPLFELRAVVCDTLQRCGWTAGSYAGFAYDHPDFIALQAAIAVRPEFAAVRSDPALRSAAATLLAGEFRDQQGDVCRVLFPNQPAFTTPPHQDQFFLRRPDEVWSAWIPLGDCPSRQGSLAVVPRSARLGLLHHDPQRGIVRLPRLRWRRFDFAAGDVLFVHSLTIHKALHNESGAERISVDFRFAAFPDSARALSG